MAVNQRQLLDTIRAELGGTPERSTGYREELMNTLVRVIESERQHQSRQTTIRQDVRQHCEDLGQRLIELGWTQ